jgi:ribosomal protein S18 acetylase RimI-like enzyme
LADELSPLFRLARLGDAHDRSSFDCGDEALDRYVRTQVTQDIRRHIANCFVAVESATGRLAAYYTLSAGSVPFTDLPVEESRRLPRYPTVPAVRMGRLAVDRKFQGAGLGAAMLADATARALQADVAAFMLVVDAKNERAVSFYQRHGFRSIAGSPRTLFLPLATARKVFPQVGVQ